MGTDCSHGPEVLNGFVNFIGRGGGGVLRAKKTKHFRRIRGGHQEIYVHFLAAMPSHTAGTRKCRRDSATF